MLAYPWNRQQVIKPLVRCHTILSHKWLPRADLMKLYANALSRTLCAAPQNNNRKCSLSSYPMTRKASTQMLSVGTSGRFCTYSDSACWLAGIISTIQLRCTENLHMTTPTLCCCHKNFFKKSCVLHIKKEIVTICHAAVQGALRLLLN